jgi:hypothetical protein
MWREVVVPDYRYYTGICLGALKNATNPVTVGGLWLDICIWDLLNVNNSRK